ncbi:MAG TPA: proline dehydrogenase, partial [Paenibacillus sp.]|nr:proline dehydrogenase [Paenibacillus sp.]
MSWDSMLRGAVLSIAANPAVRAFFRRYGMRLGVARFVAAEELEGTLEAVRKLNDQGLLVTLDYLGESVAEPKLAEEAADQAVRVLRAIQ